MSGKHRGAWNAPRHQVFNLLVIASLLVPNALAQSVDMSVVTKENEIVPCLLSARVRKIGNMVYPERRRLVEVSARECRLKGGEFTYYDRANPEAAVAFFKVLADDGDLDAQVSLGDVYQYLYTTPDYDQAARWYQAAADSGSKTGMMQLARLYERGLGVERDGVLATNLWRDATGAGEELVLASELAAAKTAATERVEELTAQLQQSNERAESMRIELAQARQEIDERRGVLLAREAEVNELQAQLASTTAASSTSPEGQAAREAELRDLEQQLAAARRTVEDQRFQIGSMEDNLGVREVQLAANLRDVQRRNERLTVELSQVKTAADDAIRAALAEADAKDAEIKSLAENLESVETALAMADAAYAETTRDLGAARQEAQQSSSNDRQAQQRITDLETRVASQREQLEAQRVAAAELNQALVLATRQADGLRQDLALQIDATAESDARYATAEAQLQEARDNVERVGAQLAAAEIERDRLARETTRIQAQIDAAGDRGQEVRTLQAQLAEQNANFTTQQEQINRLNAQVEKYSDELNEIRLRREAIAMRAPLPKMVDTSGIRFPKNVKVGKYYAIVIGNNNYDHLKNLENAQNDARAVHELLESDYRFESQLLLDATGQDIYRAFGEVTNKAGENDLVLVYYAGHGYNTQNGSYWLPVDIKSKDDAEIDGLSSFKVAKWVARIPAKHVLIVADSCYSGTGINTTGGFRYDIKTLQESLPFFLRSKSRTMLAAGGETPVMDTDGKDGSHSVFTDAFLGLLNENRGVLHVGAMHDYLVERVKYAAQGVGIRQTPQFGSIESAGHENGQFVFLHRSVKT